MVATLRFANGALGAVEASTAAFPGAMKRLEICGSTGSAVVEEQTVSAWSFAEEVSVSASFVEPLWCLPSQQRPRGLLEQGPEDEQLRQELAPKEDELSGSSDPSNMDASTHFRVFTNVLGAINSGTSPLVDGVEGRRSVELILAIYHAAATGAKVALPLASDPDTVRQKHAA